MNLRIFIFVSCVLTAVPIPEGWAKIYIDITQVSTNSFPIGIVPPVRDGGNEDPNHLHQEFTRIVRNDLGLMGVFRLIEEGAFLEDSRKKAYLVKDIAFASWALLDALALVKGWYRVDGQKFTIELHLFDVLAKSELMYKRYETTTEQIQTVAHKFANEIVKVLSGEEGIFDTKIAFLCKPKSLKEKELCMMNFDGSKVYQITTDRSIVLSPKWAKNGNSIYYTSFGAGKTPQLYRYDLFRPPPIKVTTFKGMVIGISLDPLENLLATSLAKDGIATELYLIGMDGVIRQRLTFNNDIDVSGSFSPDGKQLVFVSNREGSPQIYKMDRNGQNVARLTFKGNNNTAPAWSPRGDKILFAGMDTDGHFDIFSMNVDGSGMVRLTYDTKNNEEPSWSPGGELITFASDRTGKYQIWSMRPDGSKQMQLTKEPWEHRMPAWGPKQK